MDLNLVTGQPGASKTLNTIKKVEKRRVEEGRPVYYANIDGLTLDGWIKMDEPDVLHGNPDAITPHSWFNVPEGAIIVIDECQDYFPPLNSSKQQPDYIMRMAKFRHMGYSMYLVTQGPNLINRNIREWVQPHIHYRRIGGKNYSYEYVNEQCIDNPRTVKTLAKNATLTKVPFDESFFGKYKSSIQHNTNKRSNRKTYIMMLMPLFVIPLVILIIWYFFKSSTPDEQFVDENVAEIHKDDKDSSSSFLSAFTGEPLAEQNKHITFNPITAYKPRVPFMPETAPAYDDLRKPSTFPKPQCVQSKTRCLCYTQQATLMHNYPESLCRDYVKNGRFDPTKPDRVVETRKRKSERVASRAEDSEERKRREEKVLQAYDLTSYSPTYITK